METVQLYQDDRFLPVPQSNNCPNDHQETKTVNVKHLGLHLTQISQKTIQIPFTDFTLAIAWGEWVQAHLQKMTDSHPDIHTQIIQPPSSQPPSHI